MATHHVIINEKTFTLNLTYKRMKRVIFRAVPSAENTFAVSLPYGTRISSLESVFKRNFISLTKLQNKTKTIPFTDKTYVFGHLLALDEIVSTYHLRKNPQHVEDFYALMKKTLLAHLIARVDHYQSVMNIPLKYKVRVRSMKSRWGSNSSQTNTIAFNEKLIHFHPLIIDSLVVHELAHYYIKGHGADFYTYLESVFPGYKRVDKMLKEYQFDGHY